MEAQLGRPTPTSSSRPEGICNRRSTMTPHVAERTTRSAPRSAIQSAWLRYRSTVSVRSTTSTSELRVAVSRAQDPTKASAATSGRREAQPVTTLSRASTSSRRASVVPAMFATDVQRMRAQSFGGKEPINVDVPPDPHEPGPWRLTGRYSFTERMASNSDPAHAEFLPETRDAQAKAHPTFARRPIAIS